MGGEPSFGAELRRLRGERALSLAGLAELTHYSKGYLSKIETGMKPASNDLAQRLDTALNTGGHLSRVLTLSERPVCPYLGLAAFDTTDSGWFFGREQTNAELLDGAAAALGNRKPLALVGPSGAGKSSLLRAGLLAALGANALPGSAAWPALYMTPTTTPDIEFTERAALLPGIDLDNPVQQIIVVIDQLEEVFTLCENEAERSAFLARVCAVAATGRALVVLGLRADFYDRCLSYPVLLEALRFNQVTVGPLTVAELRAAITCPAEVAELRLEPGLVDLLLADIGAREHGVNDVGALPLLSHALLETWQQREDTTLTVAGYRRTGGIANAVAQTAEQAYCSMVPTVREAARRLFLRLVRVGEHQHDTRRPVEREPLLRAVSDRAETEQALQVLARTRLLTVDANTVTLTHEALLHAWPRLRGWLDSDRAGLHIHQQLSEAAQAWDREARHPSLLQRGPRLALAVDWAREHDRQLDVLERDFLAASRQEEYQVRRKERRNARRLRVLVAGLTVLTVLALGATTIAIHQSNVAAGQRDTAISKALAGEATQLRATDPALAAQLSLAAYRVADTAEARGSLLASSGGPAATQLKAHTTNLHDLTFAPDGRTLITAGGDGTTRLWDLTTPSRPIARATITGRTADVTAIALSANGNLLATADDIDTTRLWRMNPESDPITAGVLPGTGQGLALAFSHNGALLAIAQHDGGVGVWEVTDPTTPVHLGTLSGHTGAVRSLAFAPNAPMLITGSDDHTSRLWDLTAPRSPVPLAIMTEHTATIRAVAFSPDGRLAGTGSDDHAVALWTMVNPRQPERFSVLTGHTTAVRGLAFSEDGRTIATTSDDQTVRLWHTSPGDADSPVLASLPQPAPARRAAFGAGGRILATGDDLGGVWIRQMPAPIIAIPGPVKAMSYHPTRPELAIASAGTQWWNLEDPRKRFEAGNIADNGVWIPALAYDPRGGVLAVGDEKSTRLFDTTDPATPTLLADLGVHGAKRMAMAYSPNGRVLAVSDANYTIRLWDSTDPARPTAAGVLEGHGNFTNTMTFSPDGRTLATSSNDYSTRIWDVTDPRAPALVTTLTDHSNAVIGVAFSPDGRLLATASEDHTVHLLDMTERTRPRVIASLTGHSAGVNTVAFSPDSRLLASGSDDQTTRLWDVTNPQKPTSLTSLTGHSGPVHNVLFSPDGRTLVSGSDDHTARLWTTTPTDVIHRICEFDRPMLSPDQWNQYVPDLPFRPLCT
ncbi:nSTAND1 domain-containing NTPase [Nocardia brasiliensis]